MIVRRATSADAALLARHRAAVWQEVGDWNPAALAPQIPVWTAFHERHLAAETYVAFIAEDEAGEVLASGGILVYLAIPRPGLRSERAGRVQSVFVTPGARRQGIAREIMARLIAWAREAELISLTLRPSDEARPLYLALGFTKTDELQLRLVADPSA